MPVRQRAVIVGTSDQVQFHSDIARLTARPPPFPVHTRTHVQSQQHSFYSAETTQRRTAVPLLGGAAPGSDEGAAAAEDGRHSGGSWPRIHSAPLTPPPLLPRAAAAPCMPWAAAAVVVGRRREGRAKRGSRHRLLPTGPRFPRGLFSQRRRQRVSACRGLCQKKGPRSSSRLARSTRASPPPAFSFSLASACLAARLWTRSLARGARPIEAALLSGHSLRFRSGAG